MSKEPPDRAKLKKLVRRLRSENWARADPWPVCTRCNLPVDPDNDVHWLFRHMCDSHGVNRLEKVVQKIVRRIGRKAAIRALRRLSK